MGERMLTIEEALAAVLLHTAPLPPDRVSLAQLLGRVLAADVAAEGDFPPFDKALMDGYAVCAADLGGEPPFWLVVGETILAGGTPTRALRAGKRPSS